MLGIDVFSGDAFNTFELTATLERVPHIPNLLGGMGIFQPVPVRTETVAIEKRDGVLALIPVSQRGAPLKGRENEKRNIRDFRTRRIAKSDRLMASEIQGIRAFGSSSELEQVQSETLRRQMALRNDAELTLENMRLGAIQGIVLDADGSTLDDWSAHWGVSAATEIDFDLDAASPASGAVKRKCNQVIRAMMKASKGSWVNGQTEVIALCGDAFFDDLTAHTEVRATYLNQQEASQLRGGYADVYDQVRYGNITWINYRGTDDGTSVAINTDKAKFFPKGARDLFQHVMSPGESFDWVNTPGQEFYSLVIPDEKRNTHVDIELYSYPLIICTNPEILQSARRT